MKVRLLLGLALAIGFWVFATLSEGTDRAPFALLPYPEGKLCALGIVDDMDWGSLARVRPVYDFLDSLGLQVTKTAWVAPAAGVRFGHARYTLEHAAYRDFLLGLQDRGHEIALHGVSAGNDDRRATREGLKRFREVFGDYPAMHTNHSRNLENLYFGKNRLPGRLFGFLYGLYDATDYAGEMEEGPYFWGDLAREHIPYHRGWLISATNTLGVNPSMPYHEPDQPFVPYWYSATDGWSAEHFVERLQPAELDALQRENGSCVLYTHFGIDFFDVPGQTLHAGFQACMRDVAARDALWVVPASRLLNRLRLFQNIRLRRTPDGWEIENANAQEVQGITVLVRAEARLLLPEGTSIAGAAPGVLVIDRLPPTEGVAQAAQLPWQERMRCLLAWLYRAIEIRT